MPDRRYIYDDSFSPKLDVNVPCSPQVSTTDLRRLTGSVSPVVSFHDIQYPNVSNHSSHENITIPNLPSASQLDIELDAIFRSAPPDLEQRIETLLQLPPMRPPMFPHSRPHFPSNFPPSPDLPPPRNRHPSRSNRTEVNGFLIHKKPTPFEFRLPARKLSSHSEESEAVFSSSSEAELPYLSSYENLPGPGERSCTSTVDFCNEDMPSSSSDFPYDCDMDRLIMEAAVKARQKLKRKKQCACDAERKLLRMLRTREANIPKPPKPVVPPPEPEVDDAPTKMDSYIHVFLPFLVLAAAILYFCREQLFAVINRDIDKFNELFFGT